MFPSIPSPNFKLHVGWRNIKTSITAMLVAIVYCLIGRNPAFGHCLPSCQKATALAAATFSESTPCDIGIFTV